MKKPKPFSDQLREAIDASGMTRYAICKATGIPQSVMSRFMAGTNGISMESVDLICSTIQARLVTDHEPKPPQPRKGIK